MSGLTPVAAVPAPIFRQAERDTARIRIDYDRNTSKILTGYGQGPPATDRTAFEQFKTVICSGSNRAISAWLNVAI